MFKQVNRDAIIIIPNKPFLDWAKYIIPESPVAHLYPNPDTDKSYTVYLVPNLLSEDNILDYIKIHYQQIFEDDLLSWSAEEDQWPKNRTIEVFHEWFDISYQKSVRDFVDEQLEAD